jgi:Flp pilus assembly protein TadD
MPLAAPLPPPVAGRTPVPASWLGPLAVFTAAWVAYQPSLHGGILWDDAAHLTARSLRSWAGLRRIWGALGATQQYYPVLHSAFWLEHRLWGDALLGYHLLNVALHATAACLFAVVLARVRAVGGRVEAPRPADWLAALLFTLHPVAVETVAWISEQKNTLSLVFYFLAALAYLRFDRSRSWGWYALAFGLFVAALLSKSVTATLPAALLLVLAWRRGRLTWRGEAVPLLPWLAVGITSGLFTAWVERTYVGAQGAAYQLGPLERLLLAGRILWFYLGKLAWPAGLSFFYPHWTVEVTLPWAAGILGVAALLVGLWRIRGWSAAPLVAFLFFAGSLVPVLGFFNVYPFVFSYVADHWQYLPSLGIFALAAEGAARAATGRARPAVVATTVGLLAIFLGLSRRQSALYRDAPTLYADALAKDPACWIAHNNLGALLSDQGDLAGAVAHLRAAVRLKPEYADAHNNLGNALARLPGGAAEARGEFAAALRLQPGMWQAESNLGRQLAETPAGLREGTAYLEAALAGHAGDPDFATLHGDLGVAYARDPARRADALREDAEALRLDPGLAVVRNNLGVALARAGRPAEAAVQFERTLAARPGYADAHDNLGSVLLQLGRRAEAVAQYRAALALDPQLASAHFNLGNALRDEGDGSEAVAEFRQALRLAGESPEIRNSLGSVLLRGGRPDEAAAAYARAVELRPGSALFRNNLGIALTAAGRLDEAEAALRSALRLAPGYQAAHYNLGLVLRRQGRPGEAAAEFTAAGRPLP